MLLKARKVTKFRAMIPHFGLKWRKIALRVEVPRRNKSLTTRIFSSRKF